LVSLILLPRCPLRLLFFRFFLFVFLFFFVVRFFVFPLVFVVLLFFVVLLLFLVYVVVVYRSLILWVESVGGAISSSASYANCPCSTDVCRYSTQ